MRHGQIKANRLGRWHGSTDSPLTWRGKRQAKRTGRHLLQKEKISAVYSSPLQRCLDTAKYASEGTNLAVNPVAGLQEMGIGEWEDMSFKDLSAQHDFVNRSMADLDYAAPGGESLAMVAQRVTDALHYIDQQHNADETVLVVSHGVALAVALAVFIDGSASRWVHYQFNNCSLTEFVLTPEPVVYHFNQSAHL
jgi:broad specificity phosphatase PhoE